MKTCPRCQSPNLYVATECAACRSPLDVGAGDVVAALTTRLGVKPCPPCQKRREMMNRALRNVIPRGLT